MKLTILISALISGIFSFILVLILLRIYSLKVINKLKEIEKNTVEACVDKTVEAIQHKSQ